jgi:oligopeptide transport system substrate-binding protein
MLTDVVMRGYGFPGTGGFVPPGMPGHSAGIGLGYDPRQAQELLAQAGYPGGRGFPDVQALVSQGGAWVPVAERLQGFWRENMGIDLTWETLERAAFYDRLDSQPPHMFFYGWGADYPDPDSFLRLGPLLRQTGWQHEAYAALVDRARAMTDQEERLAMYRQADRMLVQEAAIMPFSYARWHLLIKPRVQRFPTSAIKRWYWKDVVVEPQTKNGD